MEAKSIAACAAIVGALLAGCTQQPVQEATKPAASAKPEAYAVIPPKKDTDLKLYYADGRIVSGAAALGRMQQDAELILWLAGNQFFAMDDVVRAFQGQNRGMDVGLITLPPGLLLAAIEKRGWTYEGKDYPGRLPPQDSLRDEVAYAIGALTVGPRQAAAARYLSFLATPQAQTAYAKYGFVNATADELRLKAIPQGRCGRARTARATPTCVPERTQHAQPAAVPGPLVREDYPSFARK